MCHQSVGLIARCIEAAGIPTVGLTSARTITQRVNAPRSIFLDVPLGHTSGPPGDAITQRAIVRQALELGHAIAKPGSIVDLEYRWVDDDWKRDPLGWSRRRQNAAETGTPAGDTRTGRAAEPQYQSDDDRRLAESTTWDEQCETCLGLPALP